MERFTVNNKIKNKMLRRNVKDTAKALEGGVIKQINTFSMTSLTLAYFLAITLIILGIVRKNIDIIISAIVLFAITFIISELAMIVNNNLVNKEVIRRVAEDIRFEDNDLFFSYINAAGDTIVNKIKYDNIENVFYEQKTCQITFVGYIEQVKIESNGKSKVNVINRLNILNYFKGDVLSCLISHNVKVEYV